MTKISEYEGAQTLIVQGDDPPLPRLDGESEPAYAGRLAFCRLPPKERSVAAAYRSVKNEPMGSKLRAPGHYHRWARKYDWAGSASRWDTYILAFPSEPGLESQSAIRQKEIEQTQQLQEMIDHTLAELRAAANPAGLLGWMRRLLAGSRKSKLAELQVLTAAYNSLSNSRAAALKDTSANRPAALIGPESDWE